MLLADFTTLRLGGPATISTAHTEAELLKAADTDCLFLAGGSNLVIDDQGVTRPVTLIRTTGLTATPDGDRVRLVVAAGESFDDVVATCVAQGWSGLEALSGIPGSAGATPIQNVGAYGQEIAQTATAVRAYDRRERRITVLDAEACAFSYRSSRFKAEPDRFLVLSVQFDLLRSPDSAPIRYAELARHLGVIQGDVAPLQQVRDAVLRLRASKGMVLDPADHDTWSAGSFFTNPVVSPEEADRLAQDGAPLYEFGAAFKTSAAWLIEQSGFAKGYRVRDAAQAGLSTKHTLALTNRGRASTEELLELARTIRSGVRERFGVTLVNEPVLWNCAL